MPNHHAPAPASWALALKVAVLAAPSLGGALRRAALDLLDGAQGMASLGHTLGSLAPRLGGSRGVGAGAQPSSPEAALLAQSEGTTHRPVSYVSSPSLPGTLNAP